MEIINGSKFCDDRGYVGFINELNLSNYKRFYTVENHEKGFIRAWHGHKEESKVVICLRGSALIGVMPLDYNENTAPVMTVLTGTSPKALVIPGGNYNGAKTLTDDCLLIYMSDKSLGESHGDDYRLDWDAVGTKCWEAKYR
jgi:dTDP-4-dehydrorhamnose 3,5-epimerase-like enzyme